MYEVKIVFTFTKFSAVNMSIPEQNNTQRNHYKLNNDQSCDSNKHFGI